MPNSAKGVIAAGSEIVDMIEPRILRHERSQAERADNETDEDEADNRGDAEARESGDDDASGTEDHEGVGKCGSRFEIACHRPKVRGGGRRCHGFPHVELLPGTA